MYLISCLQYFEHVEEAEWAVQTLKETGKPVAACMCIGPDGDMHGVTPGDCAVRLVKAGGYKPLTVVDMNNSLQGVWSDCIPRLKLNYLWPSRCRYCGSQLPL